MPVTPCPACTPSARCDDCLQAQADYVRAQVAAWLGERVGMPLDTVQRELRASTVMRQVEQAAAELAAARSCEVKVEAAPSDDPTVMRFTLTCPPDLALELGICPSCRAMPCSCDDHGRTP